MKSTYFRFLLETEIADSNQYKRHFCTSIMAFPPYHSNDCKTFYQLLQTIDTIVCTAHTFQNHIRLIVQVERDHQSPTEWIKIGNPNLIQFSKSFRERIQKELDRLKD